MKLENLNGLKHLCDSTVSRTVLKTGVVVSTAYPVEFVTAADLFDERGDR